MRVYLVDGTYELYRAHFGAPSALVDGQPVGAVRGLVRSLGKWLRSGEVTHVGIAFDTVIESFRNRLFAGYKTGEGIEPDLWAQFPLAEEATRALGLRTWSMIEFEADDALATAGARLADDPTVDEVRLTTPDKDLAQCVRGVRVVGFDRAKELVLDEAGVRAKFGVAPASIPDYLALVGDAADGIPGIPRWGAASTAAVLAHYLDLDAIPDDPAAWQVAVRGAKALAASLAARRTDARLYRELATLRRDAFAGPPPGADLGATPAQLCWRGLDGARWPALAARLGIAADSLGLPVAPS